MLQMSEFYILGTKWRTHRKMLTHSFHFSILIQFIKIFETVGDSFIKELKKEEGKASVDIFPLVSLCTLDTICGKSIVGHCCRPPLIL